MSYTSCELCDPSTLKDLILETIVSEPINNEQLTAYEPYRDYCCGELRLLQKGIVRETWQTESLAVRTHADVAFVIDTLRRNSDSNRSNLRQALASRFPEATVVGLNQSIDLAIRLWLMMNFQERRYETLRLQATCIEWNDFTSLQDRIVSLFPNARWKVDASTSRLGPYFNAVFLTKVCGLKIEWTTSLYDHLRLDRRKSTLRIFPYKHHLEQLLACDQTQNRCPIPTAVLNETVLSLGLLFPIWDSETVALLKREKQTFQDTGPFESQTLALTLADFNHWRDRLLELREILEAPPASWAQLWMDRRNPQQFWTFWIALFILVITLASFVTGVIQAWASVKALNLVLQQNVD